MANLLNECNVRNLENATTTFKEFCATASDDKIAAAIAVIKNISELNMPIYEIINSTLWSIHLNSEKGSDEFRNSAKMLKAALK